MGARRAPAIALSGALLLASCGQGGAGTGALSSPGSSVKTQGVTECGAFTVPGGVDDRGERCFTTARAAGESARLRVSGRTPEGDLVIMIYTALDDGRVEHLADSRQDSNGSLAVTRAVCRDVEITGGQVDPRHCTELREVPATMLPSDSGSR